VRLAEQLDEAANVRLEAIQTISKIARLPPTLSVRSLIVCVLCFRMHEIADHASRVVHPFARILVTN
jgi:hypothetical protein